jgi:hypothetical protein
MPPSFFLDHAASYAVSSCGAPPGVVLYTALPHAGHGAAPYGASLYNASPGAAAAVPHAGYAAPYAALLHADNNARNASPTYVGYVAPNAALPHAGHTAFYVASSASTLT